MLNMGLKGVQKYEFWDWCLRKSAEQCNPEQKACVHDFGKEPVIITDLEFAVWQCKHCKRLDSEYISVI